MLHYLRLLRPLNLIIMVATMYFMRIFVLGDILSENDFQLQMGEFDFALLVLSLVLIAAGGNIINDYFDVRADRVNKPHKVIVGKYVKRRIAMASHIAFNAIGILIGGFLAWKVGMWKLVIIHLFAAGSLWYYSVLFKREFLIGNIVIALLAALVPLAVGLFEIPLVIEAYGAQVHDYFLEVNPEGDPNLFFKILFYFILGFAGFAFLLTLVREIQKDLADVRGDIQVGCKTMPAVIGIRRTKLVVTVLLGVSIIIILMVAYYLFGDWITLIYSATAVVIPLGISMWRTIRAHERADHVAAFTWTKVAMATGLCYAIVFSEWVV